MFCNFISLKVQSIRIGYLVYFRCSFIKGTDQHGVRFVLPCYSRPPLWSCTLPCYRAQHQRLSGRDNAALLQSLVSLCLLITYATFNYIQWRPKHHLWWLPEKKRPWHLRWNKLCYLPNSIHSICPALPALSAIKVFADLPQEFVSPVSGKYLYHIGLFQLFIPYLPKEGTVASSWRHRD